MAGLEQFQSLTESFAELAKSNSEIREKLDHLYNGKKIKQQGDHCSQTKTEIQKRLQNLQCRQESSDAQLSILCDQVDKLVDRLDTLCSLPKAGGHKVSDSKRNALKKNEDPKTNELIKSDPKTINTDTNYKSDERKTRKDKCVESERLGHHLGNNESIENKTSKKASATTVNVTGVKGEETETDGQSEIHFDDSPSNNPPMCRNKSGLRFRQTSLDEDNRNPLSEVRRPRWQKLTSAELKASNIQDIKSSVSQSKRPRKDAKLIERVRRPAPSTQNEYKNLAGFMKDLDDAPVEERDISIWTRMAETERRRGLAGEVQSGGGPSTCLLLDISQSMTGRPFRRMIKAAKSYVKQIEELHETLGIEENIGLATFGHDTGVVQHMTNDYRKIRKCLDMLQPGGPSPMSGGLFMALACCYGQEPRRVEGIGVQPKTIIFTDGQGTPDKIVTGDDNVQINFEDALHIQFFLNEATTQFRKRRSRIFCVPIGDGDQALLNIIVKDTNSKMYSLEDIGKLARMTNNTIHAITILQNFPKTGVDTSIIINELMEQLVLPGVTASDHDEIKDLVEYYKEHGNNSEGDMYVESDQDILPVGSRVRRGPDWMWKDQDSNGAGTIIGHSVTRGTVWVEWDNGDRNTYRSSAYSGFDILPVDEPRVAKSSKIQVGCLVVRGPNWTNGNEDDGGLGNVGVVLRTNEDNLILVRWPNKKKVIYSYGNDGQFEVELCDPSKVRGDPGNLKVHVWGTGNKLGAGKSAETPVGTSNERNAKRKDDEHLSAGNDIMAFDILRQKEKKVKKINAQWSYQSDGDIWIHYTPELNLKIEKAYGRNSTGSTIIELENKIYKISFLNMTQECNKTGESIKIKRNEII